MRVAQRTPQLLVGAARNTAPAAAASQPAARFKIKDVLTPGTDGPWHWAHSPAYTTPTTGKPPRGLQLREGGPRAGAESRAPSVPRRRAQARPRAPAPRPAGPSTPRLLPGRPSVAADPDPREAWRGPQRRPLRHLPGPRRPPPALSPAGCARSAPPQPLIPRGRELPTARRRCCPQSASSVAAAATPVPRPASSRHQRNPPPPAPPPPRAAARGRRQERGARALARGAPRAGNRGWTGPGSSHVASAGGRGAPCPRDVDAPPRRPCLGATGYFRPRGAVRRTCRCIRWQDTDARTAQSAAAPWIPASRGLRTPESSASSRTRYAPCPAAPRFRAPCWKELSSPPSRPSGPSSHPHPHTWASGLRAPSFLSFLSNVSI
ncbi:Triple Functional Domain Protein [Manis pentadactyla]|nr:Triple Functional Domain Protein [Manis pentadactyla]